jgi:hypothetical protein
MFKLHGQYPCHDAHQYEKKELHLKRAFVFYDVGKPLEGVGGVFKKGIFRFI